MDLTSMPTSELIRVAGSQAQAGTMSEELLTELGIRYAYRECPNEDKAIIAEFDQKIVVPLLGFTRLPPGIIHLPGARPPTVPIHYQQTTSVDSADQIPATPHSGDNSPVGTRTGTGAEKPAKAFISYSHKDAELLNQFHEHLSALKRQNLIDTSTDRSIDAGAVIDDEVRQQMEAADLYLLLISSAFLESDYCFEKEFSRASERQRAGCATVVPIIIREWDWKIPALRKFKALPKDGKPVISRHWHTPDEAFADVASGLRALLEKGLSPRTPQKTSKQPKKNFVPDERHLTEEQREELRKICGEIIDRLTAGVAGKPDAEVRKAQGRWFGMPWWAASSDARESSVVMGSP